MPDFVKRQRDWVEIEASDSAEVSQERTEKPDWLDCGTKRYRESADTKTRTPTTRRKEAKKPDFDTKQ